MFWTQEDFLLGHHSVSCTNVGIPNPDITNRCFSHQSLHTVNCTN